MRLLAPTIFALILLAIAGLLTFVADAGADPPPDPISIDAASASAVGACVGGKTPADIYGMGAAAGCDVAGPGPILEIAESVYSLGAGDDQDGHSAGELDPWARQVIYFSGETASAGVPGTDYEHQAIRSQAEGDRFVTNGSTFRSPGDVVLGAGPTAIAGPFFPVSPLTGLVGGPHLLSANQTFYNEIPTIGPAIFNATFPLIDDMDALELVTFDPTSDGIHDSPIYFVLALGSPSLPGGVGGDVFVSPPGGGFGLFAPFTALGLFPPDMIDAIAVWDGGAPLVADGITPLVDFAIFSLAPGSFSLAPGSPIVGCAAAGCSPADIFVTDFTGVAHLYLPAAAIGLLPTDNIDALDVEIGDPQIHDDTPIPVPAVSPLGLGLLAGTLFGLSGWLLRRGATRV